MFLNQMKTGSSQTRFSFGMQLLFNKPPSIFDIIKNICWENTVWQRLMCNFFKPKLIIMGDNFQVIYTQCSINKPNLSDGLVVCLKT